MKKTIIICSALLVLAACNSCNTTNRDENSGNDFEEAKVIASATFGPDDTPDSIAVAIKAASLPMRIEWDCNGKSWIAADCDDYMMITFLPVVDSCSYICDVAQIIFDNETWLRITYTEDITGQYWLFMSPESECGLFYKTDLFDPQAEPYQFPSHSTMIHTNESDYAALIVRYVESGTLDTVPLVWVGD